MTEITQADRDAKLIADLRSSAKAFRENTVYTQDGDPVRLTVQAGECDAAADRIAALSAPREPGEAMIEEGVAVLRRFDPNSDMLVLVVEEIYRAMTAPKETE